MVVSNFKYQAQRNEHTRLAAVFMMWAGKVMRTTDRTTCTFTALMHDLVLHHEMLEDARTFFMSEGIDGAWVTPQSLNDIAFSIGLIDRGVLHDFKMMADAIGQHRNGLISDAELIKCLQCNKYQVDALLQYLSLPPQATDKVSLMEWDTSVMDRQVKNDQVMLPRIY